MTIIIVIINQASIIAIIIIGWLNTFGPATIYVNLYVPFLLPDQRSELPLE